MVGRFSSILLSKCTEIQIHNIKKYLSSFFRWNSWTKWYLKHTTSLMLLIYTILVFSASKFVQNTNTIKEMFFQQLIKALLLSHFCVVSVPTCSRQFVIGKHNSNDRSHYSSHAVVVITRAISMKLNRNCDECFCYNVGNFQYLPVV